MVEGIGTGVRKICIWIPTPQVTSWASYLTSWAPFPAHCGHGTVWKLRTMVGLSCFPEPWLTTGEHHRRSALQMPSSRPASVLGRKGGQTCTSSMELEGWVSESCVHTNVPGEARGGRQELWGCRVASGFVKGCLVQPQNRSARTALKGDEAAPWRKGTNHRGPEWSWPPPYKTPESHLWEAQLAAEATGSGQEFGPEWGVQKDKVQKQKKGENSVESRLHLCSPQSWREGKRWDGNEF